MTKLYELTGKYLEVAALADDPDFPIEAIRDTLEGIEGEIEVKAEALLKVIAGFDGTTGAIDTEIKRLQARKKALQNRKENLRDYLFHNMQTARISKIECPFFSITLGKARPMVVINNESMIPDEYVETQTTRTPKKDRILKALKAGKDIPGCALGSAKQSLTIT